VIGPHLLLTYDYVDDIVERRAPHRDAHLAQARAWLGDGRLIAAGAVGDPPTGALFVFSARPAEEVEAFVAADPYLSAGLVTGWRIAPWNVVVGAD
jgi:uncharacterized protein YciI